MKSSSKTDSKSSSKTDSKSSSNTRKTPQRRCVGCFEMMQKIDLLRIVSNEDTENPGKFTYSIDFSGKQNGRGAYVCKNLECILKASKIKGFDRSFKHNVPKEVYELLKKEFESFERNSK